LLPSDVMPRSNKKVWWQCPREPEHVWQAQINNRVSKGNGCPFCSGRQPVRSASLAAIRADLLEEWDWELNVLDPWALTVSSNQRVWWVCQKDPTHKWRATVAHRSAGTGCPRCSSSMHSSFYQRVLEEDLALWLGSPCPSDGYVVPGIFWPQGKAVRPDFIVIAPPVKLVVEYDGLHHVQPSRVISDKAKNRMLQEAGFIVVRIRQAPLRPLESNFDLVWHPRRFSRNQTAGTLRRIVREHLEKVGRKHYGGVVWESLLERAAHVPSPSSLPFQQ